ncbi:MAG: hypothetical protein ACFFCT_02955 [Candidatus Odinarchaeota archaeon]
MTSWKQLFKGLIGHLFLLFVNFSVLVGIIGGLQLFFDTMNPMPLLNSLLLGYMLVHTCLMLSVQLGIQVLEIIKIRFPTILIWYYFKFDDNESIPIPLLDPTKTKLAILVLLLVISGGPVLFPIFAIYGFLFIWGYLTLIAVDPSTLIRLFAQFLNWMPPFLALIVFVIVASIVMIEFRHE